MRRKMITILPIIPSTKTKCFTTTTTKKLIQQLGAEKGILREGHLTPKETMNGENLMNYNEIPLRILRQTWMELRELRKKPSPHQQNPRKRGGRCCQPQLNK